MRLSVDMGGTFTDLVVDDGDGRLELHKTSTTSPDPIDGILAVLEIAASGRGRTLREFLSLADTFIHGTTRAINAVVTGTTARTAFLVTAHRPLQLSRPLSPTVCPALADLRGAGACRSCGRDRRATR